MNAPNHADDKWHLSKSVPITIVLALAAQAAGGLWFIAELRRDIDILKIQMQEQRERDSQQDRAAQTAVASVQRQLENIDSKLDRLIERNGSR